MTHLHTLIRIVALAAVAAVTSRAPAQPLDVPPAPSDPVAIYRLDPTGFHHGVEFLPLALQIAERYGLVDPEFHPLFDGILAAGVVGTVPHSLVILDLDAEFDEQAERGYRILDLKAVLVLETAANHRTYLETLSTILSHYGLGDANQPALIALPDGSSGARYRAADWASWQAVEWASLKDSFVVGLGEGSLEQWGRQRDAIRQSPTLDNHRRAVAALSTPGRGFFEVFLNFDRLHDVMPEVLAQGRPREMLVAWNLDNARNWMIHGRWTQKFLSADLTWQRRSALRRYVVHRRLTLDRIPEELSLPMPPGDYVAVIPIDFEKAFNRIIEVYRATLGDERREEFDAAMDRYRRRHRTTLRGLWQSLDPYVVLSNYPRPVVAVPGATTMYFESSGKASPEATQKHLAELLQDFMRASNPEELGDAVVRHDPDADLYWLQLEPTGVIRVPAWGWADGHLVAGWAPGVVETNRQWLAETARP